MKITAKSRLTFVHSSTGFILLALCLSPLATALEPGFDKSLFKEQSTCTQHSGVRPMVYLVKQWHLPPSANTKMDDKTAKNLPQSANQTQIYQQLSQWIEKGSVDTLIAEGCSSQKIDSKYTEAFQGWKIADLEKRVKDSDYGNILAHPVLKLEAKYGEKVNSVCGDDLTEIKNSQAALSDARADAGYYSRLKQHQNDPVRLKGYLEGAIEAYHLPANAGLDLSLRTIKADLKQSLEKFKTSTHARDLAFVKTIEASESKKPVVLVVGGLHATDLKEILQKNKMNCIIFEPLAYQNDEEKMESALNKAIEGL